ncbi:hypothetical protein [Amycolatopsis sp. NPDC059021]|uniref:hypothetical protein n=1 Tax=Amycolatopsis sp. NPDC059021 TaxID=3346704 RepID=UPI0036712C1E
MIDPWYAELEAALDVPYSFERRPDPIAASMRPERRVPLLLLLVAKSHGSGASWKALQLLSWAVRSPEHIHLISQIRDGEDVPDQPLVRFEPALDRAIDLAVGLNLLEDKKNRVYRLTNDGRALVKAVQKSNAFERERSMLDQIEGKVTQKEVSRIIEWRHI